MSVHDQELTLPALSHFTFPAPCQGFLPAEKAAAEQHPFQRAQIVSISRKFEGGRPRV
jgi:hypothetical protein